MRAAARGLLDLLVSLFSRGVDRDVGAAFTRKFEFVVGHVDGDNFRALRLRKLNRQMAESADAEYGYLLTGLNVGLFHRAVNCKPGAEQRRGLLKSQIIGKLRDVARLGFDIFGEAPV